MLTTQITWASLMVPRHGLRMRPINQNSFVLSVQEDSRTMRNTVLCKLIPVCRIAIVGAVLLALSFGSKDLWAQSPASLEVRSENLSVTLDAKFPRVFKRSEER